eukprot:jgi/Tetstr1/423227/TSEL_001345.t1
MGFPIFLSSGGRTKRVAWNGKTFTDLAKLYFEVFSIENDHSSSEHTKVRRGHFYLKHTEYGVLYEGFELSELGPGSLVEIRGPHSLKYGAHSWEVDPDVTGSVLSLESDEDCETDDEEGDHSDLLDFEGDAQGFREGGPYNKEPRTLRQKIWKTLEDPGYSRLAKFMTIFIMATILLSTVVFIVDTMPLFHGRNTAKTSPFYVIEATCIAIFTLELLVRMVTAPPHLISFSPLRMDFFRDVMNIVDILAILPFYIEMGLEGSAVPGLAVLRVVRLVRVFRLSKVSKGALVIFLVTMKKSAKPLYMLIFFTALAVVIFSSLMYYAERASCESIALSRTSSELSCFLRYSYIYASESSADFEGHTIFYSSEKTNCQPVYEVSPYQSIPATMWWCLVTMTTVGYGDMYPVQWYGRLLGMLVMLSGILVIALPITVIGSNFADVYRHMMGVGQASENGVPVPHEKELRELSASGMWATRTRPRSPTYAASRPRTHSPAKSKFAERLIFTRVFNPDEHERSANVIDALLAALEDKRLEFPYSEFYRFTAACAWEWWVSRAFFAPKPGDNQRRFIIDLRVLNTYRARKRLRMETLMGVRHLTKKGDYMFSFDLQDGSYALATAFTCIRARYTRSAANVCADRMSPHMDIDDWQLDPVLFAELEAEWGAHSVDCFASSRNAMLPRYSAAWLDPGCKAVDSLRVSDASRRTDNNYCKPPWPLLPTWSRS